MSFIKSNNNFMKTNFKGLKFIVSTDKKIIKNIFISSILRILKNWYIFISILAVNFSQRKFETIFFIIFLYLLISTFLNMANTNTKINRNSLRNAYNKIISEKKIKSSIKLQNDESLNNLSQILNDYQNYNGGPIVFLYSKLEESIMNILIIIISVSYLLISLRDLKFSFYLIFFIFLEIIMMSFINARERKIESENNSMQKVLTKSNRMGNFYFSLLSSEFLKMKSIRNNNHNNFIEKKYSELIRPLRDSMKDYNKKKFLNKLLSYTILALIIVSLSFILIYNKMIDNIIIIFLISSLFISLENLLAEFVSLKDNEEKLKDFFKFINAYENFDDNATLRKLDSDVVLKLNNLSFSYNEKNDILKGISYEFKKGNIYAIVGENGHGKTTLIKAILNMIKLKDENMIEKNKDFDNFIAFSLGADEIFSFNIGENIGLRENFNEDDIEKFLINLSITENLKGKLFTKIGKDYYNDGREFSGGQQKKLLLLRVLYLGKNLIILDEPTSSMDVDREKETYNLLRKVKKDKAILIISHRLGSALMADEILIIRDGKLYKNGKHDLLYKEDEYYRSFYDASRNL